VSGKDHLSCLALSSALRSAGLRGDKIGLLEERAGLRCGGLLDPGSWLSCAEWERAADAVEEICAEEKEIFLTAGRKLSEMGLMGAMEFLPWFLSTPQLVLRNIAVFQDRLDKILEPTVDYVTENSCRIGFIPREGVKPPRRYLPFLQGYLQAVIGLWDCTIDYSSAGVEESGRNWFVHLEWKAPKVRYRRALEELFVDSEFFSTVVEELFKISRKRSERLSEMLRLNQSLRKIALSRVTEKEITRGKLEDSDIEQTYLGLFSTVNDGIFRIKLDGTLLDANTAALSILGYRDLEELRSRASNIRAILGEGISFARIASKFQKQGVLRNHPIRVSDRFGSLVDLMVSAYQSRDPKSGEEVIEGVLHDITDTRKVRQALGHTQSFLEAVFDHSPSGLQVVDIDGRIIKVNHQLQEIFGFDPAEIVGSDQYSVFSDKVLSGAGIVGIVKRAFEGETVQTPLIMIKENTSQFCKEVVSPLYLAVSAYPLRVAGNRVSHAVVSYTDNTENYLIEQQISQLHKLQSIHTLASGIAHDFNNILAAIVPSAEMILTKIDDPELVERKAKAIKTAAKRAAALTSQLLSFARESRGDRRSINLNEVILEAMELINNIVPRKIVISFKPEKKIPAIDADPLQVQQVLINLIINACDASPLGGTITVKTFEQTLSERVTFGGKIILQGRYVGLSVVDEGMGMPQEVVQRVFDPFFTTKEKGKGTGLGLSVVHGIVKNHGGYIRITSSVGKGTRFDVFFPAFKALVNGDDK
jgi:PAS domain S-box-containing protein